MISIAAEQLERKLGGLGAQITREPDAQSGSATHVAFQPAMPRFQGVPR
jgi:hypothetical protein